MGRNVESGSRGGVVSYQVVSDSLRLQHSVYHCTVITCLGSGPRCGRTSVYKGCREEEKEKVGM